MGLHKTPLRYPGGKQKLAPFIAELMRKNDLEGGHYAEPYAGGAGVGIELLLSGVAAQIHLNDACEGVYSFWKSVLSETEDFCRRISAASLNVREWRRQQAIFSSPDGHTCLDIGFSFFYLNRVNRSGILRGGLIGGLSQDGEWRMDARFPRSELIRRIESIARKKKAIKLKNWDAERFIIQQVSTLPKNSLIYCDPPYFGMGDRLYVNHYKADDHKRIARVIQRIKQPWVVSYDGVRPILDCYGRRRAFLYDLQYNASKAYKGTEVFFFSDNIEVPAASSVPSINHVLSMPKSLRLASKVAQKMAA